MSGLVLMFNITDSCWNKTSNQTTYVLHFICKDVMRLIKAITKTTMYIQTIPVLEKREWHWHMAHNSEQASVTFLKCSSTEWVLFNRTARISSCDYEKGILHILKHFLLYASVWTDSFLFNQNYTKLNARSIFCEQLIAMALCVTLLEHFI